MQEPGTYTERFAFLARRNERKALCFDGDTDRLHRLTRIPAQSVVSTQGVIAAEMRTSLRKTICQRNGCR